MDKVSIGIGVLLIALGVGGFIASGEVAPTALIPAYVGAILALLGIIVAVKPTTRKHVMHAAATVALLGFLAATGRLLSGLVSGRHPSGLALFSLVGMAILCALFVLLAVRSFIATRRARQAQAG